MVLYFTNTPVHTPAKDTTMNASRNLQSTYSSPSRTVAAAVASTPVRHVHRERDFGVGYGNSSGYASQRRYTTDQWAPSRFRCL